MTDQTKENPGNEPQQNQDDLASDWAAALSEQQAGETSNQAQGLEDIAQEEPSEQLSDDWASALAEQTAAETHSDASETSITTEAAKTAQPAPDLFKPLTDTPSSIASEIDMVMDIPVQMSVELGRTRLTIKNILQLGQGSVVELDGLAGEPMDIYVNGYLIAQGEVVVVDEKYGIRITDIITPSDRINRLNKR